MWPASSNSFNLANFARFSKKADYPRVVFAGDSLSISDLQGYRSDIAYSAQGLSDWVDTFAATVNFKDQPQWSVVVAQHCTRLFSCVWGSQLRTVNQFLRYAQIEFERRFALPANDWQIEPSQLAPNRTSLFCAFPAALISGFSDLSKRSAFRMQSLMPYALAEFEQAHMNFAGRAKSAGAALYIGSGYSTKPALLLRDNAILDVVMIPSSIQDSLHIKQIVAARWPDQTNPTPTAHDALSINRLFTVAGSAAINQRLVAMGMPIQVIQQTL